jgi:hypothetical protein
MNPEAFRYLRDVDVIKFVIASWEDYGRANTVLRENPEWRARIVFSPALATDCWYTASGFGSQNFPAVPMEWPRQLAEKMIEDGVNAQFSLQIHKVLWPGAKEER